MKPHQSHMLCTFQGILRQDKTFVDALVEYAPLLYPLGPAQSEEAMTILLTLLANNKGKYTAKLIPANFSKCPWGFYVQDDSNSSSKPSWGTL